MFVRAKKFLEEVISSNMSKKGQLGGVVAVVGSLATLAILFGISVLATALIVGVVADFQATQTADSLAFNTTTAGLNGMNNFTSNFTTIGTILGAVVMILIVIGGLGFAVGRRFN